MTESTNLATFAEAIDADVGEDDPGAAIAAAADQRPDAVADELASVADALATGDDDEQLRAAETAAELFRVAGPALADAAPRETWLTIEALLACVDGAGQLAVQAREAVSVAPYPGGFPPYDDRDIPAIEELAGLLVDVDVDVRRTAARVVAAIARHEPDAVPPWTHPLAEHSPAAARVNDAWPLGVVARDEPAVGQRAVEEAMAHLRGFGEPATDAAVTLLGEVGAGDPDLGRVGAQELTDVCLDATSAVEDTMAPIEQLVETHPDIAIGAVARLVGMHAGDRHRAAVDRLLVTLAEHDPDRVRAAVEHYYDDREAFLGAAGGEPAAREAVVETAFGDAAEAPSMGDWLRAYRAARGDGRGVVTSVLAATVGTVGGRESTDDTSETTEERTTAAAEGGAEP